MVATWLDALGLHIPGLLGDMAGHGHASCHAGMPTVGNAPLPSHGTVMGAQGDALLERTRKSQEAQLRARDPETSRHAQHALRQLFARPALTSASHALPLR